MYSVKVLDDVPAIELTGVEKLSANEARFLILDLQEAIQKLEQK